MDKKPGFKTSELTSGWGANMLATIIAVNSGEPVVMAAAALAIGLQACGYAIGRGLAKRGGA